MQRLTNSKQGTLGADLPMREQNAIIREVIGAALQEMENTAGPDQQITGIQVDLSDSIDSWAGNMLSITFTAEVSTRLR